MKVFKNFEEILCGFFLLVMVILVILNVILRYFFSYSLFWSEEVATICFVWLVFLGSSAVYKNKMSIGIDVLIKKAPESFQNKVTLFVQLLMLLINGYIFYMSVVFTFISHERPTAVLGVSSAVVNSALIFGFGLMSWHSLRFLWEDLNKLKESA